MTVCYCLLMDRENIKKVIRLANWYLAKCIEKQTYESHEKLTREGPTLIKMLLQVVVHYELQEPAGLRKTVVREDTPITSRKQMTQMRRPLPRKGPPASQTRPVVEPDPAVRGRSPQTKQFALRMGESMLEWMDEYSKRSLPVIDDDDIVSVTFEQPVDSRGNLK